MRNSHVVCVEQSKLTAAKRFRKTAGEVSGQTSEKAKDEGASTETTQEPETGSSMGMYIGCAVVLIIVLVLAYFFLASGGEDAEDTEEEGEEEEEEA